jgi:outer membrane protein assembly factor BamB
VGDALYVGSCSGILYALDRRGGTARWTCDVRPGGRGTSFHGDPLIAESLLVIGTDGGNADTTFGAVWALELATGRVRWHQPLASGIVSDIRRAADNVLAVTREDELLCFDLATGRLAWSFRTGGTPAAFVYRSPAVAGTRVFFGGSDGVVYALDRDSGRPLWKRSVGSAISTGILALGQHLHLATERGRLVRLSQATGEVEAELPLGTTFTGPPVPVGDSLIVLVGERSVACVDTATTRLVWTQVLPAPIGSPRPYLWRDQVIAGTERGELFSFRARDGMPRWSHHFEGVIRGIGCTDRVLYVGTLKGLVYAYRRAPSPVAAP